MYRAVQALWGWPDIAGVLSCYPRPFAFGTPDRNRTCKPSAAAPFEDAVVTVSPQEQGLAARGVTLSANSPDVNTTVETF